jgi:uncharacterized protein with FMN-binding domain
MRRVILGTAGTVAGLVAVLSYTPLDVAVRSAADGPVSGLGAPPPVASDGPTSAPLTPSEGSPSRPVAVPSVTRPAARRPSKSRAVAPVARSSSPAGHTGAPASTVPGQSTPPPAVTSTAQAAPTKAAAPPPRTSSKPPPPPRRSTPRPTPTKPPAQTGPKDYTGAAVTYKYGTMQVAVRIQNGKIVDAWAVTYPQGTSKSYSEYAIPLLRSRTIAAQSAKVASASGATFTSAAWVTSLQSALTKAGV